MSGCPTFYPEFITRLVRGKIEEICAAGDVSESEFIKENSQDQVLTDKELAKYLGAEEKRWGNGVLSIKGPTK